MKKVNLKIDGLHCKSCKALIESEVKAVNKVKDIDVDLASGSATLEFDGNIEEVYKTIEDLGYTVIKNENNKTAESETSKKKILF